MDLLVYGMILCGSVIMLLNIVQYSRFMMNKDRVSVLSGGRGIILAPLVLMVLFLIGYIGIGILVEPQFLIGAILFGGSLFVFLALHLLYYVLGRVEVNEERLEALYAEMRGNLEQYTKDALAVFRVNLTRDRIEERDGTGRLWNRAGTKNGTALKWSGSGTGPLLRENRKSVIYLAEI